MSDIGKRICAFRTIKKLSQKDLAEKLETSTTLVAKWENGTSEPKIDQLLKLAKVFGISVSELLGEEKSEVEPTRKTEKSGEGKADAFFKRNGTIIIQLALISMSLIGCIVGFSYSVAVTDYLPVYMLAVMFVSVFFIAGILMFCVFVKPGGIAIKILKIILLVLCFGSAMTYFGLLKAFDDMPDVGDYIGFFIFSGASYAVLSIAVLLNILVEFRVLKSNAKIEMEKSIFILLVCALVFAICLFVANITVCSYAYYEEYDHFQWLLENDESYDWWY